jgi:hypothetical protein
MILQLRQRHRRMFLALGILLPVAFAVGLAARKPLPEINSLPKEIAPATTPFAVEMWSRADLFPKSPVQVRLLREQTGVGRFGVVLSAAKDFVKPDLLVYWSDENSISTNALPDNAILLGAFNSASLPLPPNAQNTEGELVLYSLADNEIVDKSKPIHLNDIVR